MNLTVKVKIGLNQNAAFQIGRRVERALKKTGDKLLERANFFVPIDQTRLAASGYSGVRGGSLGTTVVEVGYGNTPEVDYARYVEQHDKRHGTAYNSYYSNRIASGKTHARRPQEKRGFLEETANLEQALLTRVFVAEVSL